MKRDSGTWVGPEMGGTKVWCKSSQSLAVEGCLQQSWCSVQDKEGKSEGAPLMLAQPVCPPASAGLGL